MYVHILYLYIYIYNIMMHKDLSPRSLSIYFQTWTVHVRHLSLNTRALAVQQLTNPDKHMLYDETHLGL